MIRPTLTLLAGCCLLGHAPAAGQDDADQMVLLDKAKMTMADGKLEHALELLEELEPSGGEPLVDQEILFQRMLLNAAFLAASHYLLEEVQSGEFRGSAYANWLAGRRRDFRGYFINDAQLLLEATEERMALDFVRFRLPEVTDEYLADAGLYADAQVLSAASSNYADGREGLGRGVVVAQARVALVLFAAEFYELPGAADSLEQAADRLRAGVPIEEAQFLFWLEDLAAGFADKDEALLELSEQAAERAYNRGYRAPAIRLQRNVEAPAEPQPNADGAEASE